MDEWDESKHPRDDEGKFTDGTAKTYRQNTSYSEILAGDKAQKTAEHKVNLSKQEWAMFYERIGKIKKEGHYISKTANGDMIIPIETNDSNVVVIASGTYQKPKVKYAVRFKNNRDLYDAIEVLKDYEQ